MTASPLTFFSICSANYMPLARTLHASLRRHHPGAEFILFLADVIPDHLGQDDLPFEVVEARDLGIASFADMAFRYDIMEFNTAIKPFCFQNLFRRRPGGRAVYLDPDILVTAPMTTLGEVFDGGAELVLTPHALAPLDDGYDPDDRRIMQTGAYNLGFAGMADSPETRRLLDWWADHMKTRCLSNLPKGLFVDQKFMDFAPAFVTATHILRHRGYNVAYWNLHERPVVKEGKGYRAGPDPLVFFHFSGVDRHNPEVFSRHQNRFTSRDVGDAAELLEAYKEELRTHDDDAWRAVPYAYGRHTDGTVIVDAMRRVYRRVYPEPQLAPLDTVFTFDPGFYNAPSEDVADPSGVLVTRLMHQVWRMRQDLRSTFNLMRREDRAGYANWFAKDAAGQHGLPNVLVPGALDEQPSTGAADAPSALPPVDGTLPEAVQFTGYLSTESGLGEAARMKVASLAEAGVPILRRTLRAEGFVNLETTPGDERGEGRVLFLHVNADRTLSALATIPEEEKRGRYRIGYWAWELPVFPDVWLDAAHALHEIWAPSRFIADAIGEKTGRPVLVVPHSVSASGGQRMEGRRRLGIVDPETVLIGTVFDTRSFIKRKNPLGALQAFRKAFPDPVAANVALVLKSHGPLGAGLARQVFALAARTPGVIVQHEVLSGDQMNDFIEGLDVLLSPHRSEGFGLNLAQAMARGKAAVATGWSGNTDFMTSENSILLDYELRPLAPGDYVHAEGQRWAEPDLDQAAAALVRLTEDAAMRQQLGANAAAHMAKHFSISSVGAHAKARLDQLFQTTSRGG